MRPLTLKMILVILTGLMISALPASALEKITGKIPPIQLKGSLDVTTLAPGRHHFEFTAGYKRTGDPIRVPIIVIKGTRPGKRLLLTAAVHGDELNGIGVIHKLVRQLNPNKMAGVVIALPGINRPGMEGHSRFFGEFGDTGTLVNLNRVMPGKKNGTAGERFAYRLWHAILKPNADLVIDLHTQSRGTAYPLYVFADFRSRTVRKMAYSLGPDVIKKDTGLKGTVETTFMRMNVPAVTLEIGSPKIFQPALIKRTVEGIKRVMISHKMLEGVKVPGAKAPFVGTKTTTVTARNAGILVLSVTLLDKVSKGQMLGCIYNNFGEKIRCYKAPHNGVVLAIATDPLRQEGSMIVRLIK